MAREGEGRSYHDTLVSINEVKSQNVIRCHWVFAIKMGADGSVECYKARIIMKGFSRSTMMRLSPWLSNGIQS